MVDQSTDVDKLESFFAEVIQKMNWQFTSHELLLRLAHDHQQEYVGALASYMENGTPFKELHHELIKRLRKLDGQIITLRHKDYPSRDIFGVVSTATVWRKKNK
ncbi:MAG: hypothetical protein HC877_12055 [Thioploca sp.]|nr:hypothetical protein [Thioploca sp.]